MLPRHCPATPFKLGRHRAWNRKRSIVCEISIKSKGGQRGRKRLSLSSPRNLLGVQRAEGTRKIAQDAEFERNLLRLICYYGPMSRSVHTQPKRVRAPRRVQAPFAPRREGDPRSQRAVLRTLKIMGLAPNQIAEAKSETGSSGVPLPRIKVKRISNKFQYALRRTDIIAALKFFGEACTYGLRSIELLSCSPRTSPRLTFGRLYVPGRIVLYAQPKDPWSWSGRLSAQDKRTLKRAGAVLEEPGGGLHTRVTWPGRIILNWEVRFALRRPLDGDVCL